MIPNDSIDFIIFVSQTPDYRIPATAHIIQNKLCLKRAACFDINLGCSGYIYGLAVAFSLINNPTTKMVLLLAGDTPTKFVSPDDKSAILLFGDAGTATIIEKSNKETDSFFLLNSDGGGANSLMIHGGGYRNQSSFETLVAKIGTDGNQRNMEQLIMDGGEIFNFTIREVPKNINELLRAAKVNVEDIDSYTFHQANKFMLDFLIKKAKLNPEKIKFSINKFGNTSVASIPLTLIVNSQSIGNLSLLSGFGVGLSWGSALLKLGDTKLLPLFEL